MHTFLDCWAYQILSILKYKWVEFLKIATNSICFQNFQILQEININLWHNVTNNQHNNKNTYQYIKLYWKAVY